MRSPFERGNSPFAQRGTASPKPAVFSPLDIPGLIGWYDASEQNSLSFENDKVTQINNRVPDGLPLKALGTHGTAAPQYDPASPIANGHPALIWSDAYDCGLDLYHPGLDQAVQAAVSDLFLVCAYKGGVDADFDGYTRLIADGADATISQGQPGNDAIRQSSVLQRASKNGSEFSTSVLPLPLSVLRFSAADQGVASFDVSSFGRKENHSLSRSWVGPICEVLACSEALTPEQEEKIMLYFKDKWNVDALTAWM